MAEPIASTSETVANTSAHSAHSDTVASTSSTDTTVSTETPPKTLTQAERVHDRKLLRKIQLCLQSLWKIIDAHEVAATNVANISNTSNTSSSSGNSQPASSGKSNDDSAETIPVQSTPATSANTTASSPLHEQSQTPEKLDQ